MATDMYGVRVLEVDPDQLRASLRVFVVHYETQTRWHLPLPGEDPSVFLHLLWEGAAGFADDDARKGPLGRELSVDDVLDYDWVDANARRFVAEVRRTGTRNTPPTEEQWRELHDLHHLQDGGWQDEELLVQGEYRIRVTDRAWLEHLSAGDAWGSAAFPMNGDTWTAEDAPHLPDLARPVATLRPFETTTDSLPYESVKHLEFSEDGAYLAVCSDEGRVWVYDTTDWSETAHVQAGDWGLPLMMWVPGEHVLVVKAFRGGGEPEDDRQWAWDVDRGAEVEVPFQRGHRRSGDGAHRISPNDAGGGGFDLHGPEREPYRRLSHSAARDPIQCHAFSGDSSRLFLGAEENLYVVDPARGEVVDRVADAAERLLGVAANPDGTYLAVAGLSRKRHYLEPRPREGHELCVWRMADKKIILGHQFRKFVDALAWTPHDGRHLAVALEPTDDQFDNDAVEIVVFPMGPDEHAERRRAD